MANKQNTAVEWFHKEINKLTVGANARIFIIKLFEQAKAMEKEQALDFGEFIIDELEPMAQNRDWVEERYNHFKSE